jgi:hypothetical protein
MNRPKDIGNFMESRERAMCGGAHVSLSHVPHNDMIVGPKSGAHIMTTTGYNDGVISDSNLGASKQHHYLEHVKPPQQGGKYVGNTYYTFDLEGSDGVRGMYPVVKGEARQTGLGCLVGGASSLCGKVGKVSSFNEVSKFWSDICPGAVKLYKKHLHHKKKDHHAKVVNILRRYTFVFCKEVAALASKDPKKITKCMSMMKKHFKEVGTSLDKFAPESNKLHKMIVDIHLKRVSNHKDRVKPSKSKGSTSKKPSKSKSSRTRRRSTSKKPSKSKNSRAHHSNSKKFNKHMMSLKRKLSSSKKTRRNRSLKGGYRQYGSNVAMKISHSVPNPDASSATAPNSHVRHLEEVPDYSHFQ